MPLPCQTWTGEQQGHVRLRPVTTVAVLPAPGDAARISCFLRVGVTGTRMTEPVTPSR